MIRKYKVGIAPGSHAPQAMAYASVPTSLNEADLPYEDFADDYAFYTASEAHDAFVDESPSSASPAQEQDLQRRASGKAAEPDSPSIRNVRSTLMGFFRYGDPHVQVRAPATKPLHLFFLWL